MKISPKKSGASEFLAVLNKTMSETLALKKKDPGRLFNLRCSQIPYCPHNTLLQFGAYGMNEATEMMSAYYFAVGHAVHKVFQDYLMHSGRFIADYECKECGKKYPLSQTYECCGFPTSYEEVEISYKGIVGHIDGIFVDSQGRVWIVDYKTCTLENSSQKAQKPSQGYSLQVRAYAYLLWKQYNIKVVGCMLVYLPRDNPQKPKIWEIAMDERQFELARKELMLNRELHRKTLKCSSEEEYEDLLSYRCGGEYCRYCHKSNKQLSGLFSKFLKADKYPISKTKGALSAKV
jgi:PD-(D/E)XK nuclease superfamily